MTSRPRPGAPRPAIPPERRLATNTARDRLFELVNELSAIRDGSAEFSDHAVEIGPRGRGGTLLIPSADAQAILTRMRELETRIDELEDELEDLTLAQLIEDRRAAPGDRLLSLEDFAERAGRGHLLADR